VTERLAVTDDDKADQTTAVQKLRVTLESQGFTTGANNLAGQHNDCRWYAWRRLPAGARDCDCNEKPPSLIVTPHLFSMRDRQYASVEVSVTGQKDNPWFALKAYSIGVDELPESLPQIEAALLRAWNALHKEEA
jgi:hypothetical protein